jgi:rhamnogalacturonan endolyase
MPASTSPAPARHCARPGQFTGRRSGRARLLGLVAVSALAVAGTLTSMNGANAAANVTFDTGSGLAFTINGTNGNMTSLKHNGVELAAPGQAAGQFESGWSSATVTAKTFDSGNSELISAANGNVTQYYFARKGDNTIYLATNIAGALNPGEARFISRLSSTLLPTSPVAARTGGSTATVEGSDVFSFSNGQTASKFYSSQRLIAQQPFGAHGSAHGVYILGGTHEMSSGGPFFRDIEVNNTGTVTNITNYLFSGHAQTEAMRIGLHGPYAMAVTNGGTPSAVNPDFLSAYIPGLLSVAQRGTVTGTASGSWGGLAATAALAGPNGQYWAPVSGGTFTIAKVRPGSYTATLYAGELAVGTKSVTVSAGGTSTVALSGNSPANGKLFQIGTFDGTPKGFLNADKIETMHPSDVRMSNWKVSSFTATSAASGFPMALFKSVNSPVTVNFSLSSVPAAGARLRIATTLAFAGGRPAVTIGGWTSPASASPAPTDLNSRAVTRGTWRGINTTYAFTIPASALKTGTNSLVISTISGSSGTTYLSPNFVVDALALDAA